VVELKRIKLFNVLVYIVLLTFRETVLTSGEQINIK